MRAALGREPVDALPATWAPRLTSAAGPLLLGAAGLLTAAAIFFGGGSSDGPLLWIGGGAVLLALVLAGAALLGRLPWPGLGGAGAAAIALLAAFVLWNGVSILWSIAPDRSWSYFNRGLAYFAFVVVGLFAGALVRRAPTRIVAGLALVIAAAVAWALAGKVVPALFPDGARIARLRSPVGYWNALALLCAMGLPLSLWIAARRRHADALRPAGVLFLFALIVAVLLTHSRGGVLVGAVAVASWFVLGAPRLESLVALIVATPFALAVAKWAFGQPGVVGDLQPYETRVADGAQLGVALALAGAAVWSIALVASRYERRRPLPDERRRALARAAAAGLATVCAVALALLVLRSGDPAGWLDAQLAEFKNPNVQVSQDPSRLTTLNPNNRWTWWKESWEAFEGEPVTGTGAGSFELAHRLLRENALTVREPHNVALQFLSETGIVGFLLIAAAAAAAVAAVAAALRRLDGAERAAAAALAAAAVAFVLHSLADWDWDFIAVSAPFFLVLGALVAAGRPPSVGRRRFLWALGTAVLASAALYSVAAPWLAEHRLDAAYGAIGEGAPGRGAELAREAHLLNPLAVGPLFAMASAEDLLGKQIRAQEILVQAVELQPLNPDTWYELGSFELRTTRSLDAAFRHLDRSYALDPYGPAGPVLDELRAIFKAEKEKCFRAGTC